MVLRGKRIFIVEDDAGNLAVMSVYLRQAGAWIGYERWGYGTCELIKLFQPVDAILLDLMFPGNVTGYEIYDHIRKIPELVNVPIIAVSAADPDREAPRVKERGFKSYIGKPITASFSHQIAAILECQDGWISP